MASPDPVVRAMESAKRRATVARVRLSLSDALLKSISDEKLTRGEVQLICAELSMQAARMTLQSEAEDV